MEDTCGTKPFPSFIRGFESPFARSNSPEWLHFKVAVIGAGPAGLMAAEVLAEGGARVTVYDRMPSVGRKFLLAGRGGLNLTHSEELDALPRALRRGDAASARRDRGVPAGCGARLVRGPGPGHVRRIERPRIPEILQDFAAAARLVAAARRRRRRISSCGTIGSAGTSAALSCSMRPKDVAFSMPMPWSWRSAAQAGRGSVRTAAGPMFWQRPALPSRRCGRRIAASSPTGPTCFANASRASL